MKKLLSFTLIFALVLSSVSFAFAEPDTWAFKNSDTGKLQAYDELQNRWEQSNIKGYKELEYVSMRYVSKDNSVTQYGIEFDYYENGDSEKYGFDDVRSEVVFYKASGDVIDMSGRYTTDIVKSTTSGKMTFTIEITSSSGLPAEFAMVFEARLAGPGQSSQWSGASLHARMVGTGNKEVSIVAPPYATIEVIKEFTGQERPDKVVIHFDGDSGNYEITLDSSCAWKGMIPNVEPGEYTVSEEFISDNWQVEDIPETVNVVIEETVQVTVTNTYDPPVTTSGSITFVKEWEGDFVPESGYVKFTVNEEYPFATVEYPSWTTIVEELTLGTYNLTEEWVYETGDQTYYNVSGIPQTIELTETTPDATFTVVNHMNPPTGDVMFEKEWIDDAPAEVTTVSTLWTPYGGGESTTVSMYESTSWSTLVEDVPLGKYTVEEIGLLPGWTSEIEYKVGEGDWTDYGDYVTVPKDDTLYIKFINEYGKGDVMFEKEWIDDAPAEVTTVSTLWTPYGGGESTTVSMYESTSWSTLVEDVPLGKYTVEEIGLLPGWTSEIEYKVGEGDWTDYGDYVTVPKDDTLYIKFINEYGKGDVMFEKEWIDDAPAEVTTVSTLWTPYGGGESTTVSMYESTSWSTLVEDVPLGKYTVEEIGLLPGWTSEIEYKVGEGDWTDYGDYVTVPKDDTLYIKFINTYEEFPTGMVKVQKLFEGVDELEGFEDMEFTIQFTLRFPDGETVNTITNTYTGSEWLATPRYFNGIPVGSGYVVEETIFEMTTPLAGDWSWIVSPTAFAVLDGQTMLVEVTNTYNPYPVDITKTVSPVSHYTGSGPVTYTVRFTNNSETTFDAFWVQEGESSWFNPDNASNFNSDMDGNPITTNGDIFFNDGPHEIPFGPGSVVTATWTYTSNTLGVGEYLNSVTGTAYMEVCEYLSRVAVADGDGEICTMTAVAWDNDDATLTINRRSVSRDDDPGVRIEKSVDVDEASVGDTVNYTIEVRNTGDVSLRDVMVVDDIIDVEWDIGDLGRNDSISEDFEYEIQETDFVNGVFENIAEVTADSREGKASDTDDAVVEEETIDVPPVTPPETPPEIVVPPEIPPQALPQTGQVAPELFYGLGSILMAAGYGLGRKKKD